MCKSFFWLCVFMSMKCTFLGITSEEVGICHQSLQGGARPGVLITNLAHALVLFHNWQWVHTHLYGVVCLLSILPTLVESKIEHCVLNHSYTYSETCNERSLWWDHFTSNVAIHFYTVVPLMKGHLSYKCTLCKPLVWSNITGLFHCTSSVILLSVHLILDVVLCIVLI